jgi:hypothetical protein
MATILNLSDLSPGEIDMLRKRADAAFSTDGKTVTLPPSLEMAAEEKSVEQANADAIEAVRKMAPPVPEDVAKKLSAGFAPPSSMAVTEDGKTIAASGPAATTTEKPPKEASPQDIADYVRCLLGGKPFTKTYTFMGGMVSAVLRERTAAEEEDVIRRASRLATAESQRETAAMFAAIYISRYRLAYALTSLRIGDKTTTFPTVVPGSPAGKGEATLAIDQRVADISAMPAAIIAALGEASSEFSEISFDIAKKATDPKYWQTAPAV